MASARNGTHYVGAAANLPRHVTQHRESLIPGFTAKYRCHILVQYELHPDMPTAIARENNLKPAHALKKITLIVGTNPTWRDLYDDIIWTTTWHCEPRME
jgi:putative endonuclease